MFRAASGDGAATWAGILAAGVPAPAAGVADRRAHIDALRSAFDAARSALGVANFSYTDPNHGSAPMIRAIHVQRLQQRAQ
jgi:hypothetical protein